MGERCEREVRDKCKIMRTRGVRVSRVDGETSGSLKSCGQRIESVAGDRDQVRNHVDQREHCALGDKWREVGEKSETRADRASTVHWVGDKRRQVGDKPEIMRAENPECSETTGRQGGGKREIMRTKALRESRLFFSGKQARRQTPNHAARACALSKGVRTPHR